MIQTRASHQIEDETLPDINEHEWLDSFGNRPLPSSAKQARYMSALFPSLDELRDEYHSEIIPGS